MEMINCGKIMMLFVFMVAVVRISHAQWICGMSYQELMACRPSATPPNPSPPTPTCCTGLSHADVACLCTYRNSPLLSSFRIDPNLALQLPGKCGFPYANCN